MRRPLLLLLAASLLAGCVLPPAPDAAGDAARAPDADESWTEPSPPTARPLNVSIRIDDRWVLPRTNVTVTAEAPPGAALDWYLANRNPPVPGEPGPLDRFPVRDTGPIEPNATSRVIPLDTVGRYVFHAHGAALARLNVSVIPGVPEGGVVYVALVGDRDASWRFAPADLEVRPGTRLAIRNAGDTEAGATLVDYQRPLGWRSALATFRTPTLLGDYDVILVGETRDGGRGEASVRLIVDNRKPDPHVTYGPYEGNLDLPDASPPLTGRQVHDFESRFNLTSVLIRWNATSDHPFGAAVRLTVESGRRVIAEAPAAPDGTLQIAHLPKGNHRLVVDAEKGVDVDYEIHVTARRVLETPESFFNRD